jgi:fluoroquinolone transport system permease protein
MKPAGGGEAGVERRPVRMLLSAVGWDLRLQLRYQIVTISAIVTLLYSVILPAVPAGVIDDALVVLIFSDPSMLGFLFVGALVLFERGANTLQAVVVTPLSSSQYLWSKAISLTLIAVPCGFAMAVAGRGVDLAPLALLAAIVLTSLLFVFLGFVGVARARTVNEYLLIVPFFFTPLILPLLGFAGVADTAAFYVIPSQASLILFQAAFEPRPAWEIAYAVSFLLASLAAAFAWARRAFETSIRSPGRPR